MFYFRRGWKTIFQRDRRKIAFLRSWEKIKYLLIRVAAAAVMENLSGRPGKLIDGRMSTSIVALVNTGRKLRPWKFLFFSFRGLHWRCAARIGENFRLLLAFKLEKTLRKKQINCRKFILFDKVLLLARFCSAFDKWFSIKFSLSCRMLT